MSCTYPQFQAPRAAISVRIPGKSYLTGKGGAGRGTTAPPQSRLRSQPWGTGDAFTSNTTSSCAAEENRLVSSFRSRAYCRFLSYRPPPPVRTAPPRAVSFRPVDATTEVSDASALISLTQLAFGLVAGVGATTGLVIAYRKHQLEIGAEVREDRRLLNERFGTAATQLASDLPAVRLAGIYSMAGLADDCRRLVKTDPQATVES